MRAILLCVAMLLGGCGGEEAPPAKEVPGAGLPNPVTDPIVTGERLREEMRVHNDQARARRSQIDEMFEKR
jgi:hypothetical protein